MLNLACWGIAHFASADALLNLFLALAFVDIYRYWEQPESQVLRRVYVWIALGLLTKGPVAVLVPLVSGLLFFASTSRLGEYFRALINPGGWALLFSSQRPGTSPFISNKDKPLLTALFSNTMSRVSETFEGHGGNVFYYVPVLLLMLLPFTGLFLQLLRKRPLITVEPLERYWVDLRFCICVLFTLWHTIAPLSALRNQSVAVADGKSNRTLARRSLVVLPAVLLPVFFVVLPELLGTPRHR